MSPEPKLVKPPTFAIGDQDLFVLALARFRFAESFITTECGVAITARNSLSILSAASGRSQRAAISGAIVMGFDPDFIKRALLSQSL